MDKSVGQVKKACACLRRPSAKREGVGRRQPPPDSKAADLYQRQTHAVLSIVQFEYFMYFEKGIFKRKNSRT